MWKGLPVGLVTPVAGLCVLFPQYERALGPLTHILAAIVFCHLRDLSLARFPGTVPTFLCASFHPFQALACHCVIIQNFLGWDPMNPTQGGNWFPHCLFGTMKENVLDTLFQSFIELELN